MTLESKFQAELISELHDIYPEGIILKNDANYLQGFPDITILLDHFWAVLETKRYSKSSRQPNQQYYIEKLDEMSFAAFISRENRDEVLHDLQQAFRSRR